VKRGTGSGATVEGLEVRVGNLGCNENDNDDSLTRNEERGTRNGQRSCGLVFRV
jgi:hypothetical protein